MRLTAIVFLAFLGATQASWFSSPEYASWSSAQLQSWLAEHNVPVPSASTTPSLADLQALVKQNWDAAASWTADQSTRAQVAFAELKADAFDAWDESRLKEFLLEQGVVNPSGPREQLVLLAKQKYAQASSLASTVSASASTAVYGDWKHQASKSASSAVAQATEDIAQVMDDTKDYVYSTWDDNRLRAYLEEHGVIETKTQATRNQLLAHMRDCYAKVADPIWEAWSDSYIHNWLIDHGIIQSTTQKKRDQYLDLMRKYYYDAYDTVYSSWTNSQVKAWLVERGVIKSEAQLQREKMMKLISDNYVHAQDTVWSAWSDSQMKEWLVEHGYIKSDAQKARDELVDLMNTKYREVSARMAPYLVWPDARLRAFLRERGVSEEALPTSRPGLLQETRIRYVQASTGAEALFARVREVINGGVEVAEEQLGKVLEILTGGVERAGEKAKEEKSYVETKVEKETKKVEL
ncbi:hypothetical protein BKA93DRAFT_391671 [Sparassis latifolia]